MTVSFCSQKFANYPFDWQYHKKYNLDIAQRAVTYIMQYPPSVLWFIANENQRVDLLLTIGAHVQNTLLTDWKGH